MVAAGLALLGAGAGCAGDDTASRAAADPPPEHVHGLGVNPADEALYMATHTGLFRMERGSTEAARVGDSLQDTMGFAIAGPDRFLGSGHPDLRDDLPPLLGLISSEDGGESWDTVSLLGEADFHALRVSGSRIIGYDAAGGRLMTSRDGGTSWSARRPPAALFDLVEDPGRPGRLVASSEAWVIRSDDGGRSWSKLLADGTLLAWPAADALYGIAADGQVERSRDGGETWEVTGDIGGEPAAVTATGRDALIVALHDGDLVRTSDAGRTWNDGAWQ
jgi:photosystem II stability/assembly factor-like uncharacterized protein